MAKTVRVHDDTHETLMRLKAARRCRSIDEVVRQLVKASTGATVSRGRAEGETQLMAYAKT